MIFCGPQNWIEIHILEICKIFLTHSFKIFDFLKVAALYLNSIYKFDIDLTSKSQNSVVHIK